MERTLPITTSTRTNQIMKRAFKIASTYAMMVHGTTIGMIKLYTTCEKRV